MACDGHDPERPSEAEKVAATREVIENEIDWPCQIERLYSDVNQGCRLGVSRAITWFFEQVEEGIILEDDCVPHPDFFSYCTTLLEHYRHDTRVWSVCGSNFQLGNKRGPASYYFSIYPDPWGWATWRRAWSNYSIADEKWPEIKASDFWSKGLFCSSIEVEYWNQIFDELCIRGKPNTWDYRWFLTCWSQHALHAWPNNSLIENNGFGEDATHTLGQNEFSLSSLEGLQGIIHPSFVAPNRTADEFAFSHRFGGYHLNQRAKYGRLYPLVKRYETAYRKGLVSALSDSLKRRLFNA